MEKTDSIAIKGKKPFTIFGTELVYILLLGIFTAFLGWAVENAARGISLGIIDSRFHILPFIPAYALIPLAFHMLFGNPDDIRIFGKRVFKKQTLKTKILSNAIVLFILFAAVFFGELAVGNFWDKCFHVQLWDYSRQALHVTQYAGLISTLGFGGGAYILFKFVYIPAIKIVRKKIPYKTALIICCTLGAMMLIDSASMILHIAIMNEAPVYWSISLK